MRQLVRLVTMLALLALASSSFAQSPTALSTDSESVLVNKNVGSQQWAISRSFGRRSVSGNVFEAGSSEPQFVFCEHRGILNDVLQLACYGTGRCADSPCADAWVPIANVPLPASFFSVGPEGPPGLDGILGEWRLYDYSPAGVTVREGIGLSTIELRSGRQTAVGEDALGHEILVQYLGDVDPGSPLPYEFIGAIDDGTYCRFYYFNRDGDTFRGRLNLTSSAGGMCGGMSSVVEFEAARLGTVAMMMPTPMHDRSNDASERAMSAARDAMARTLVERLP